MTGKLIYAGRAGTGMLVKAPPIRSDAQTRSAQEIASECPLLRKTCSGSSLVVSRRHRVEPELVAEITYSTWTADNLLRHTVYVGLREDKSAEEVRREYPRG